MDLYLNGIIFIKIDFIGKCERDYWLIVMLVILTRFDKFWYDKSYRVGNNLKLKYLFKNLLIFHQRITIETHMSKKLK